MIYDLINVDFHGKQAYIECDDFEAFKQIVFDNFKVYEELANSKIRSFRQFEGNKRFEVHMENGREFIYLRRDL